MEKNERIDKIKDTLTDLGQDIGERARRFSGTAKLQYDLRNRKSRIRKLYLKLGERYYKEHVNEDDEDIAEINVLNAEVEEIKKELEALKEGEK